MENVYPVMFVKKLMKMEIKEVFVAGGDLFEVSPYKGVYYIYKLKGWGTKIEVGKADNFDDALSFIKAYNGKQISSISSR